jgi:adenylate cyclase
MEDLSAEEVASQAGVPAEFVERLASLGILGRGESDRPFVRGDVYRTRVARACEEAGLPLEGIGRAVQEGKFSFGFLDLPSYSWATVSPKTAREISEETGLSVEFLLGLRQAQGFARPDPDERLREDELELLPIVQQALQIGMMDEPGLIRLAHVYSEALRRIAEAETHMFHSGIEMRALDAGMDQRQIIEFASTMGAQFVPLLDQTILTLYRRQRERAWIGDLIGHIEAALEEAGYYQSLDQPPAMCFLDLAGYTRITEEMGDRAAADLASSLVTEVQQISLDQGGQPVKWLGDGVMFYFKNPKAAVVSALDMVATTPEIGLPPSHAGVAAGPIIFQDGDYFGRTVNIASRIAGEAEPGQVLVSEEVVESVEAEGLRFDEVGPVELKGLTKPISLYEAKR